MLSSAALDAIRNPRRIAVVGASRDADKLSGKPIRYLSRFGYAGEIVPVSTSAEVVQGLPAIRSLTVDDGIDLAVIAVPADDVADALSMCVAAGVRACVVFAGGFGEIGERGVDAQRGIESVRGIGPDGMRVFGPNCLGFVHPATGVTATFGSVLDEFDLLDGSTALITQSGGFGSAVLGAANAAGVGCSWWVSTGNEFDVSAAEVMRTLVELDDVERLLVCTEGLRDGDQFVAAAKRAGELGKPIVMLKAARSTIGARVAASHTGAIAGGNEVFDGVARQLGIITVSSLEQLVDAGRALAAHPHPVAGRPTVVTVSGGAGVIAADACDDLGLELAGWNDEWQQRLRSGLPSQATVRNPIDVTATTGSAALGHALRTAVEHPGTGTIVTLLANRRDDEPDRTRLLAEVQRSTAKPLLVSWTGASAGLSAELAGRGVVMYSDPSRAMAAAGALDRAARVSASVASAEDGAVRTGHEPRATDWVPRWVTRADGSRMLDDASARALLADYGVDLPREVEVDEVEQAVEAARELGFPVVLKARSTELLHRSDAGLVRLGLATEQAVREAAAELRERASGLAMGEGSLVVQEQVSGGIELLVGVTTDLTFGTVMAVATGGTLTELVSDAVTFLPPITVGEAREVLSRIRVFVVRAARADRAALIESAARTVSALSRLVADAAPLFSEVDLNPLIVSVDAQGRARVVAVDWLFLSRGEPPEPRSQFRNL